MTPATGGEVDDLLEPVWSWPERTMPTELRLAKGCPAAEPLPPSGRRTTVRRTEPNPPTPQELTATDPE
jgi:hypothetical protein